MRRPPRKFVEQPSAPRGCRSRRSRGRGRGWRGFRRDVSRGLSRGSRRGLSRRGGNAKRRLPRLLPRWKPKLRLKPKPRLLPRLRSEDVVRRGKVRRLTLRLTGDGLSIQSACERGGGSNLRPSALVAGGRTSRAGNGERGIQVSETNSNSEALHELSPLVLRSVRTPPKADGLRVAFWTLGCRLNQVRHRGHQGSAMAAQMPHPGRRLAPRRPTCTCSTAAP